MAVRDIRKMVMVALFIALDIICTRFLSYETATIRIGFSYLPVALCGAMFGPVTAGAAAALADVLGMMIFPKAAFFPGFTLTAFLTGAVYGVFFYKKPKSFARVCAAAAVVCVVLNLGLDTLWIYIMLGKGIFAMLPERLLKAVIMTPIQIVSIKAMLQIYGVLWEQNHS